MHPPTLPPSHPSTLLPVARFAWLTLVWNVLVVLLGAFVSSTGSGAGCGAHWPLCQGQVAPGLAETQRAIELSHRATSGIALLLVLGLAAWAWRTLPSAHPARRAALTAAGFIVVESLLGAALVLRRWVAFDTSLSRVITQPIHLTNTLLLLASIELAAWWASGHAAPRWPAPRAWLVQFGLAGLGLLVIGSSGALISLGDLLALNLGERYNAVVAWLVDLRLWHPGLAIGIGLGVLALAWRGLRQAQPGSLTARLARLTAGLVLTQWLAGLINVALRVPLWTQLVHLLLADLTWLALVVWAVEDLGEKQRTSVTAHASRAAGK